MSPVSVHDQFRGTYRHDWQDVTQSYYHIISKIHAMVYHQCSILIGWPTTRLLMIL